MISQRITGRYERSLAGGEFVAAFVPARLPPIDPGLDLTGRTAQLLVAADHALARLDLACGMVPSLDWFLYAFVRKEAVVTSQIEGTQASLVDLLNFEADGTVRANADIEEICNYVDAISFARAELARPDGLPLSMRLLNETHRRLMSGVRGANKRPGEIRTSQNWIGGRRPGNAVFVPPPPQLLPGLLSDLERFIHGDDDLPKLIRAGLVHVQFESIHPYLDGNGRIGRLLGALLLEHWNLLASPLLYLSLFFKNHRSEYYDRLNRVRMAGDWEGWLAFFLDGVATIADEAAASAQSLVALVHGDRGRVLAHETSSGSAIRLFEALPSHPIVTVGRAMKLLKATKPTAARAVDVLEQVGVLVETTGKKRDRSFVYRAYLDQLKVGTDLDRG